MTVEVEPAEERAYIKEELMSIVRPCIGWSIGFAVLAFLDSYALTGKPLLTSLAFSLGIIIVLLPVFFAVGWCHRAGARVFDNMPRFVFGPIWLLGLQTMVNFAFNMTVGIVKGPIELLLTLARLWQLRGR